jgi:hypothetical protein
MDEDITFNIRISYVEVFFTIPNRPREKNLPTYCIIESQVAKHSVFLKFHEDQTFTVKLRRSKTKIRLR